MTRDEALQHLATDNRYAMMTAGEAGKVVFTFE